MEASRKVVDMVFAMDMWIFGGYVRDVFVRGEQKFNDIDVCCEKRAYCANKFIRVLSCVFDVHRHVVTEASRYRAHKHHRFTLEERETGCRLAVDLVIYDGSFDDWCRDGSSVDFSCNLFYSSYDVYIGLRSTPKCLEYASNPLRVLLEMTRQKEFMRIWDVKLGNSRCQAGYILKVHNRAKELVKRGWFLKDLDAFMSDFMSFEMLNHPAAMLICKKAHEFMATLQTRRTVALLPRRSDITDRIESYLRDFLKTGGSQHDQV